MLPVEEAIEQIKQRAERDWVSWALGRGSWPLKVTLGAPRGVHFDQNLTAAQLWAASWDAALRNGIPGTVTTEPRRARGLGTHHLPISWTVPHPSEALVLTPDFAQKYTRARERFTAAVDMPEVAWECVESIPLKAAKTIAEFSDGDWLKATATVTRIADGPGDAVILRQLAVPGVHSKWIEDNAATLAAMLGVPSGPGDAQTRLEAHIGLMAEQAPVNVYLACPQLRATAAGLDRFCAPIPTLNMSSLAPQAVLIVENRKFGTSLDVKVDGLVVVYGLGYGVTALADLRWTTTATTVLYWGDLDRAGLAILASLRRSGVRAHAVLMDEHTWDRYPDQQHDSVRNQGLSDIDIPEGLEGPERALYERLNDEYRRGGKDLQLEQEHIPMPDAIAAITAVLAASGEIVDGVADKRQDIALEPS